MSKLELEVPLRVSPFIRFARWSCLLVGVWYGASHFRRLQKKENAHRDYIEKNKPAWMAEKNRILNLRQRDELLYLAKETGNPVPKDFDKQFPPGKI